MKMQWSLLLLVALATFSSSESSRPLDFLERQVPLLEPGQLRDFLEREAALNLPRCADHVRLWSLASEAGEAWALQMTDAGSKSISGVLFGNSVDFGNFDECMECSSGPLDNDVNGISGLYAQPVISITIPSSLVSKPLPLSFRVAVCVPDSCSGSVLESAMQAMFDDSYHRQNHTAPKVTVNPIMLSTHRGWRQPDSGDWAVLGVFVALMLISLVATLLDALCFSSSERGQGYDQGPAGAVSALLRLSLCFSLRRGARHLLARPPQGPRSAFAAVSGIRVLSIAWIILGHRFQNVVKLPRVNQSQADRMLNDYSKLLVNGYPYAVDSFFVIGGFMCCLSFFKEVDRHGKFSWPMFIIHRYIRLTPVLAVLGAFLATWFDLIGYGPQWFSNISYAALCKNWWWTNLLYVANYVNPDGMCLGHSWYLMVDMQLFVLAPLCLIPLWKWKRFGLVWLALLIVGSCVMPGTISYLYDFRNATGEGLPAGEKQRAMRMLYTPTHTRASPYLIGVLAGFFMRERKEDHPFQNLRSKKNMVLSFSLWSLSAVLCLAVIYGYSATVKDYTPDIVEAAFFIGLHRLVWGVGFCWVIIACAKGWGGFVNTFLSWQFFTVLGRLTYCVYLVHFLLQMLDLGMIRSPEYFSDYYSIRATLSDASFSTLVSAVLFLVVEQPFTLLEATLRGLLKGTKNENENSRAHLSDQDGGFDLHKAGNTDSVTVSSVVVPALTKC